MKHQYFGDINDYRKYGLLRTVARATGLRIGVCWLLTADDERADGEFRAYLNAASRWRRHDPELYDFLQRLRDTKVARSLDHAETWGLLPGASYYNSLPEDALPAREAYFQGAWSSLADCPLLFFDPDNGLEVKSTPRGRKYSSKYIYWTEVREAYQRGHSLIVYQHFPRRERTGYTARMVREGVSALDAPIVDTFTTANVLFLLFARPEHAQGLRQAHDHILANWAGQITPSTRGAS